MRRSTNRGSYSLSPIASSSLMRLTSSRDGLVPLRQLVTFCSLTPTRSASFEALSPLFFMNSMQCGGECFPAGVMSRPCRRRQCTHRAPHPAPPCTRSPSRCRGRPAPIAPHSRRSRRRRRRWAMGSARTLHSIRGVDDRFVARTGTSRSGCWLPPVSSWSSLTATPATGCTRRATSRADSIVELVLIDGTVLELAFTHPGFISRILSMNFRDLKFYRLMRRRRGCRSLSDAVEREVIVAAVSTWSSPPSWGTRSSTRAIACGLPGSLRALARGPHHDQDRACRSVPTVQLHRIGSGGRPAERCECRSPPRPLSQLSRGCSRSGSSESASN